MCDICILQSPGFIFPWYSVDFPARVSKFEIGSIQSRNGGSGGRPVDASRRDQATTQQS